MDALSRPSGQHQSRRWTFYEQTRPVGSFERHSQRVGTLLVYGNRLALISHRLHPILDALDGQSTLREIEEAYGSAGLELVASLYEQGMIELAG